LLKILKLSYKTQDLSACNHRRCHSVRDQFLDGENPPAHTLEGLNKAFREWVSSYHKRIQQHIETLSGNGNPRYPVLIGDDNLAKQLELYVMVPIRSRLTGIIKIDPMNEYETRRFILLMPQSHDRIHPGRPGRRIQPENNADTQTHTQRQ
jgi:hypothetical protein